jgi:predicted RNA-binding protein YlxR (DUF448 family)
MVRVALGHDGRLVIDRHAPGRGAWLCRLEGSGVAQPECISKAKQRRAFGRALRREVDAGAVEALFAMAREHASIEQLVQQPVDQPVVALTGTPEQDEHDKERD